ncbi:GNAT family N-acetyltransferase [Planococcus sp. N028]|uniref:GNAT family N-acetyltransferase n=1 Tax=Planococcus shixiaomingii TaxID=3058393 RepID=A0ABT8N3F0_9BACL|nr:MULTISPECIES: GNAT family N-acetyltransferase [unclassified Planococcus (in: firmicutes)]MDN7242394.1 GNAT family N-acetyltransferase [Planococcus sp. N028]WKA54635.1 GNAT family N-acetyltransferase [Planococcus sp. N022]
MLIKYKKALEKITMGLLSFIPADLQLSTLQKTVQQYEDNPDWQLYLWKCEEDFVGVIGIEIQELTFAVHHISVNPSFRGEGIGHAMVEKVQELQDPRAMQATERTKDFLEKCWKTTYSI